MAEIVDIAAAVTAGLNAGSEAKSFAKQFVAERTYLPDFELPDLKDLRVVVVAAARRRQRITRAHVEWETDIEVGCIQRTDGSLEQNDELMRLPEQVAGYFDDHPLEIRAEFLRSAMDPIYGSDELEKDGVLICVVTLTWKSWEKRVRA
jgi:glycyl-tRNA synthetase beta subunit